MIFGRTEFYDARESATFRIFQNYRNAFCKKQFIASFFGEDIPVCENMCDSCVERNENLRILNDRREDEFDEVNSSDEEVESAGSCDEGYGSMESP